MKTICRYACGTARFRMISVITFKGLIAALALARSLFAKNGASSPLRQGVRGDDRYPGRSGAGIPAAPGGGPAPRAGVRLRGRTKALAAVRAAAGLALAFVAALALVGLSPSPAQAQTTFVSNLNQGDDSRLDISSGILAAQQFTTGSDSRGYRLSGVDIDSEDSSGDSFSASVCTVGSDGYPTSSCTALTAPGSFAAGVLSFTASPSIALAASTKYAVVMDIDSDTVSFDTTDSGGEDTGVAAGWAIANDYFTRQGGSWSTDTSYAFRIAIKGAVDTGDDATLSALTLQNATTNNAIALSPAFDPDVEYYTASVTHVVNRITITATPNDADAEVLIYDVNDEPFVDADNVKPGLQVNLSTGNTTVNIYTTSESGNSSDTYTVDVARNRLPTASNNTVTMVQDTEYGFSALDFNFSDDDADPLASVTITTLESYGVLTLDGTDVMLDQVITKADIDGGLLIFTPASGASGSPYATFGFKVNDGKDDSASAYTMTIDVTALGGEVTGALVSNLNQGNDTNAPVNTDLAQQFTTGSNRGGYTLTGVDIKVEAEHSTTFSMSVCTVDSDGFPTSSCTALTAPSDFTVTDLSFTAPANTTLAANTKYALVLDIGASGADLDSTTSNGEDAGKAAGWSIADEWFYKSGGAWLTIGYDEALRIAVKGTAMSPPNAAPTASNNTVRTDPDTAYTFSATDFNFSDADADPLASVKITTLESAGDLELDGSDVEVDDVITKTDIDGGKLTFTPASGASGSPYATFGFTVNDGTVDSASAYTMTIDVNTLPTAANSTVTTAEDTNHVFVADDFNFSDDDAGDALASVTITTLETAGRLKLVNDDVVLDQVITRTQIDEGKLKFVPDADGNGAPYTTFGFKVSDGDHESAAAYTMTVDVTPAADAPTASDGRVTTGEDTPYTFTAADFDFSDADGDALDSVKITTLETAGRLLVDGNDVTLDRVVSKADIDAGHLRFAPASGASGTAYATFGFKVSDGTLESVDAYTMTIDVTAAQGAVTGALVSNTGQTELDGVEVGDDGFANPIRRAQRFRTGPEGYVVTSVVAALGDVRSGAVPRVSLYSDASGEPGTSLHVLNNPASFRGNRNNTFTVQGKAVLRANTNYWVVFENAAAGSGNSTLYHVSNTRSSREDPGAANGWSIADTRSEAEPVIWRTSSNPLRIAIQGRLAGNDATLSALALFDTSDGALIADGSSKLFDAVRFEPDRTEYHAFVDRHRIRNVNGRLGTEITVAPTPSDSRARIIIRERDGSLSVDANTTRPGHQLMMTADGFGEVRRIRVWVTAEDGTTRKTYVVTLHRELKALRVGIHQTPNSTVEQGDDVVFQIRVTDPDPGDDVNLAAIGGSVKFKLAIVCEKRNHGGEFNDWGIRNRLAECQDLTLLGTRGGDTSGFSKILTIRDSELQKRTNAGTGVETGTMTLRVGTEPDTIQDDGGNEHQNFQENFTVVLRQLSHTEGGPPSFLKITTSEYHRFTMGSIRLEGHLNDECEYLADNLHSGCATRASEQQGMEPLTAAFRGVPVSHDGSSAFTLRLAFSEDVEVAPEDLRDHALSATGGTVTGVTRVDDAKDLFEVTVTPAGEETVSVTLVPPPGDCAAQGAVCTADGRALTSVLLTQVRGPGPGLTVADAQATEGEDDSLDFVVTLSPPATETVTVVYATLDGTATAGEDYTSKDGTLTFAPGDTTKTVSVDIEDDTVEDSGETMTLRLVGATGAAIDDAVAVGTIYNTEPLTASFSSVAAEHDGSSVFTVELDFSEDVEGLSYRTLKFGGIEVTGGTVTKAKRRPPGSGQGKYWTIHVEPDGDGGVTVVLPETTNCAATGAVCTRDGRMLANESRATVPGPEGAAEAEVEAEPEALTASFRNVPSEHDGESAFTVRVAFSEALPQGSKSQLRRALSVTGGSRKTILRVNDRLDLWEVTIEPSGTDEVAVSLASTGACGDEAALCTSDGRMLSNAASAVVEGPPEQPLTASFQNVPAEHDGESAFTLRMAFSEALPQGSKRRMWRGALAVAGGARKTILRVDDRLDLWEVTIEPAGTGAVTVSLASIGACGDEAALCTADGRALAGTVTAKVQGPPGLSVADAEVDEGAENAALVFEVTLSRAATRAVTVEYATTDGTAVAPGDYTSTSGKLAFSVGETVKTVSVPVHDDIHNDGGETMTLTLSNPTGGAYLKDATATGTITNNDPMPKAWLARFGRAAAEHAAGAIGERLRGGGSGARVTLGGQNVALGGEAERADIESRLAEAFLNERDDKFLRGEDAARPVAREISIPGLLLASSFHLASAGDTGEGPRWSVWGRGTRSGFDGREESLTLEGDVTTATLGFDYERERWLLGVALSRSAGDGSYRAGGACNAACAGDVESALTGVYPYARYRVSERLSLWGVVGHGQGDLTLSPEGMDEIDTDVEMSMAAAGARGVILPASVIGGFELALRTDLFLTRTGSDAAAGLSETEAETSRLRLLLEGSRGFKLGGSGVLTPSVELGLRYDGGDAETGSGLELGASLRYAAGSLTMEVRARGLLTHSESDYEEWGVSGSVAFSPAREGRGLSMRLGSAWGATSGGAEQLWSRANGAFGAGRTDPDARVDAEVSYGFDAKHGLLTPFTSVAYSGNAETWRAGARWQLGAMAEVSLEANLTGSSGKEKPDGGVLLKGSKRW